MLHTLRRNLRKFYFLNNLFVYCTIASKHGEIMKLVILEVHNKNKYFCFNHKLENRLKGAWLNFNIFVMYSTILLRVRYACSNFQWGISLICYDDVQSWSWACVCVWALSALHQCLCVCVCVREQTSVLNAVAEVICCVIFRTVSAQLQNGHPAVFES